MFSYPEYKKEKKEIKPLTLAEFPSRISRWLPSSLQYFTHHGIVTDNLTESTLVYPTTLGICFVMTGPRLCYQIRITEYYQGLRFWSPPGAALGQVLFIPSPTNGLKEDAWKRLVNPPMIVVEGVTDALAVHQAGFYSCALIGAKVSDDQLALLRSLSERYPLTLVPDRDEEGDRCARTLLKELPIKVRYLPATCKDICDMPIADRKPFLTGAIA